MAKPCKIIASPKLAKILNIQPNQELSYNDWARILHDGGFDTLINEEIVSIKGISPQPKAVKTNPTALSDFKAGLAKFKGAATTAQNAAERVASALKEAGIKVKMIDNEEDYNREAQKRGGGKGTEGMFISTDGVIYLNQNKLQGNWGTTIVWHEGTHPIINIIRNTNPDLFNKIVSGAKKLTADKGLQNALKFAEAYRDGMTITENSEGKFELYDGENLVDTFDSEQAAQDYIDAVVADEFIVEAIARIVDGKINIEQLPSSLRQSIVDFINNILNALGIKGRVSDTDIAQFKKLAAQVSDVLQSGRSISEIVGKENVNKFTKNLVNSDGSKFSQFRISNKFKNLINNVQYEYISDTEEFQDLIKDGKITSNKKLKDFDGLYVMLHVPDNAFTGKLIKDGNTLVDGKGGVYFPIRYNKEGYFWASTEAAVDKLVNVLNETRKANPDKVVRLALVSSKSDKIMSSANASNAMVDVLFSKAFDNRAKLTESQVKKSIINGLENAQKEIINSYNEEIEKRKKKISETKDSKEKANQQKSLDEFISKGYEVVPKINIKDNADNIKNILADFYNPDNSSFQVKKSINQNILSNLSDLINDKDASDYKAKLKKEYEKQLAEAKNEGNQKNIDRISKKINNLASLTKIEERPIAEEILKFLGLGKDAIRLKSTGGRLSSSNLMQGFSDLLGEPLLKGGESNNIYAVLELNTDVEKIEIPKEIEHGSYPFAVKGKDGAKVVLHILQDRNNWQENVLDPATNERIVDNERALEIMPTTAGVTFTPIKISTASSVQASKGQREGINWETSIEGNGDPTISSRNPIVQEAAANLKAGKITNEEYRAIASENSPIRPITRFFEPASENRIKSALSEDKIDKVNIPVEDGKDVGLRLDIPAYKYNNTWVVSVHEGTTNAGKAISYTNVAKIKDVKFGVEPKGALAIAAGVPKTTIGRMFGKWENIEGNTLEEKGDNAKKLVEDIVNDPNYVQVGMNPFRHSYFYDRSSDIGKPIVSADEVIQIGGLVYAKNPVYGNWTDEAYKVKDLFDKAGQPVQFSKGQRNQDLIDYVKNSLDNISPEDLSQSLQEDLGYTKEDADAIVDEAVREKEQGKQEQKEEPKEQPKQEPFKGREKERSFTVKQFLEDPTIPEEIKEAVTEDAIYYNELPNSISVGMANKLYDLLGVDDALNAIMDDMNGMPPAIRIVLGQVIIRRAAAEGGALAEAKIILKAESELAKRGTEYGQAIQAFSLFQWLSPEGQIMYAVKQRQAEIDAKVKEDKDKIKAKKAAVKKANQEAIEEVLDGKTGDAIDESSKAKPKETSRPKSYGENNKIVTKSRYEQLKKALKGKLFSGFSPEFIELGIYHIEAGSRKFADFSKEMIKDLGSGATKYLKDLYNAAKNEYLNSGGDASGFSDDNEIQDVENQREAEKLASFIVSRAKTKSPSLDPAKQIVATLLAKVSEKIPSQELAKLSDIEKIALAIKNREQYADVWEKSKEIVEAKIDELEISEEEKDDMKAALQAYFDEMIGQPFSDRMLKSAVRKALKDLGTDIKDVIKRHYTVADSTKRTLVEKLIMEANLSGEDARYLAARVEREFNAIATEKKKNALESIRTVGEKLPQNAKKTKQLEDKLIELSNLGAFSDEEFVRAYAESMGWKQVTQEDIAQLRKLAEIVEKEQDGFRRARAVEDLLAFHAKMKGVSFADLALSVWYANTLSGRKTQETNILGGIIGLGLGYVVTGIKNPRSLPQVTKAIMYGFNHGKLEGMSTLTTGYSPIRGKIDVPTALELTKFKGKYNPANALKYVTRFMKAVDVAVFEAGKEMRAYQYAKKLASEQLSGEPNAAQTQKALEILGNTKEKLAEAKAQAMQEFKNRFKAIQNETDNAIKELKNEINRLTATLPQGSKELKDKVEFINKNIANLLKEKEENIKQERKDVNRRIFEILEQQRTKTADDFISKTEEYGRRLTFNYQPEGILGKVAQGVNMITGAFTPLKLVVPFTNIIANIANQSLDYTPIGFLRAGTKEGSIGEFLVRKLGFGNTKASIRGNQQFDEEYRSDMLVKASMGILLTGLVYALSQTGDDDEEPILEITADGYGNYKDNYSLKETGWQPYSIKIGNRWYSYQYTPLLPMFTFIGKLNDVQKYRKEKLNDGSWTKARIAAGAASKSFFDNTYLSSLNAVLSTIFSHESDSMVENAMTSLMKTLSGFVLPNFYTQEAKEIESIMNIPTKELGDEFYANAIKDIPFLRDKYYAKVNGLGEDIVPDTDKFVSKVVTPSQQGKVTTDDLWLLLAKNKMPIRVQSFRQFNSDGVYDPKKDEIRVIDRKEYYEYTKKRGTVIKDFMMDNYDQLSKLNDEDFRYIMDDVLTESSKIAKMNLFPDEYRVGYEENQLMKTRINQKLYERDKQKRNKK